jgi:hypothetical protein
MRQALKLTIHERRVLGSLLRGLRRRGVRISDRDLLKVLLEAASTLPERELRGLAGSGPEASERGPRSG